MTTPFFHVAKGLHFYQDGIDKQDYRDFERIGALSAEEVEASLKFCSFPPGLWLETPKGICSVWQDGNKQYLEPIYKTVRIT